MTDPIDKAFEWSAAGQKIALATVISTWGSSPRPVGSILAVNENQEFEGSVSGGCVEGAVITEALDVIAGGEPKSLTFSVDNKTAWQAGLTCGGALSVLVTRGDDPTLLKHIVEARTMRQPVILATDTGTGAQQLLHASGKEPATDIAAELTALAYSAVTSGQSRLVEAAGRQYFLRIFLPQPRLHIIGATHITQTLAPVAHMAGYDVAIVDPRAAFAAPERFPGCEPLVEWPDEYFNRAEVELDRMTAIVSLTHDEKIDDPTLAAALRSQCFYIGALGSRKTHAKRVDRLLKLGFDETDIARIHAPVGLNLGGRTPAEIAIAIMAEMTAARYQPAVQT
ncbi:MAG: XdhC family protein [Hyphomicrobiales bacterium]|nr:XdhC family protein [Hyphomicrobiales bacterium]